MSKGKRVLFAAILSVSVTVAGLCVTELVLRFRTRLIAESDRHDPGLLAYDAQLGWKLTPGWQGKHHHHDFETTYSINRHGFRGNFDPLRNRSRPRCAVVGDSFTFGLGVGDDETFVGLLNSRSENAITFLNFGVPGYSTDQEFLYIRNLVLDFWPKAILLVVYLGNDLFDNELAVPLQVSLAKPYFEQSPQGLILRNSPVPRNSASPAPGRKGLMDVVLGDGYRDRNRVFDLTERFEILRLTLGRSFAPPNLSADFEKRFDSALELFAALIDEMREICVRSDVRLSLVLMPGKSFVQRPDSISAQFQDHLRRAILANRAELQVQILDLADQLRKQHRQDPGNWFFTHEGHLTPQGHQVVAELLTRLLRESDEGIFLQTRENSSLP